MGFIYDYTFILHGVAFQQHKDFVNAVEKSRTAKVFRWSVFIYVVCCVEYLVGCSNLSNSNGLDNLENCWATDLKIYSNKIGLASDRLEIYVENLRWQTNTYNEQEKRQQPWSYWILFFFTFLKWKKEVFNKLNDYYWQVFHKICSNCRNFHGPNQFGSMLRASHSGNFLFYFISNL